MIRRIGFGAVTAALAVNPVAADENEKFALTPTAPYALIMIRAPSLDANYRIAITRFDPATGTSTNGWQSGDAQIAVAPFAKQPQYVFARVRPGTYVVNSVAQQHRWSICYHAATVQFDVAAGQLLYLGSFDAAQALAQLRRAATANKELTGGRFQFYMYFDGIVAPRFLTPDATERAAAEAFVRRGLPRVSVHPESAAFRPAAFRVTDERLRFRACGGELGRPPRPRKNASG